MSLLGKAFKYICTISDRIRDRGQKIPPDIEVDANISYVFCGGKYNLLDVSRPKGVEGRLPVIVNVHGGAYVYGTKRVYKYYAASLASRGFAVINFNYHLAPKYRFPYQLSELNAVMCWIEDNAERRNFDINNVFLVGDSAGAQMASHYATIITNPAYAANFPFELADKCKIRALALNCGIYDFPDLTKPLKGEHAVFGLDPRPLLRDYIGKDFSAVDKMLHITENMTKDFPPAYIATSEYDFLKQNALPFHERLKSIGVETKYKLYGAPGNKRVAHVFNANMRLPEAHECNDDECEFFKAHMAEYATEAHGIISVASKH